MIIATTKSNMRYTSWISFSRSCVVVYFFFVSIREEMPEMAFLVIEANMQFFFRKLQISLLKILY